MGGYISRSFIYELINRVDLVDLIDSYLSLRKTGRNYIATCPFHHEKTPSFTVNPEKQFYYCFGCGAQGNAISFLMNYAHFEFVEAVHELAARIGIEVLYEQDSTPVAITSAALKVNLYELLAQVAKYYQQQLRQSQDAINYLKQRGLTGEIARDFGLGYAPLGWNNLITTYGNTLEAKTHLLETGLIKTNAKGGYYDRFRQRIMFPIVDGRGRVIAFGGRLLHDNSSEPKYLNSPETRLFQKGQELYGWYWARQTRPLPYLVVVEGYLDVITLAQYGVNNAVATLGTAVTREHLTRLFRVVPEIRFCFDGDTAGQQAAWRTLERVLPFLQDGQQVSFMFLPPGQDPDSLLRQQGKATWESCLQQASPLSNFLFATLQQQVDLNYLDGKTRLVKLAKPLLKQLPAGGYYQLLMIKELSKLTQIDVQRLTNDINDINAAVESYPPKPSIPNKTLREYSLVEQAIIHLLYNPTLSQYVEYPNEKLASLPNEHIKLFLQLIELTKKDPKITLGVIYEYWRGTEYENVLNQLGLISQGEHTNLHLIDVEQEFQGTMARLHEECDKQSQIIYLTKKLANNHLKITTELKNNS